MSSNHHPGCHCSVGGGVCGGYIGRTVEVRPEDSCLGIMASPNPDLSQANISGSIFRWNCSEEYNDDGAKRIRRPSFPQHSTRLLRTWIHLSASSQLVYYTVDHIPMLTRGHQLLPRNSRDPAEARSFFATKPRAPCWYGQKCGRSWTAVAI